MFDTVLKQARTPLGPDDDEDLHNLQSEAAESTLNLLLPFFILEFSVLGRVFEFVTKGRGGESVSSMSERGAIFDKN